MKTTNSPWRFILTEIVILVVLAASAEVFWNLVIVGSPSQGDTFSGGIAPYNKGRFALPTGTLPPLVVIAEWPAAAVDVNGSDDIRVALVPPSLIVTPTNQLRNKMIIIATPVPIYTQATQLGEPLDLASPISATAHLATADYTIASSTQEDQPLAHKEAAWTTHTAAMWDWSFKAHDTGLHTVNVSVYVRGTLAGHNGQTRSFLIWNGSLYISSIVAIPDRVLGILSSIGSIIGAVLGFLAGIVGAKIAQASSAGKDQAKTKSAPTPGQNVQPPSHPKRMRRTRP